jgi:hypothetical protein
MKKVTPIIHFSRLFLVGLTLALVPAAWSQPAGQTNYQWSAGGDKITWSQSANWVQGIAPLTDGTTFAIDTFAASGASVVPIRISATDVVDINDAIFGPLWGQTIDLYGSMTCGFGQFIWGDDASGFSTLNIHTNGYLSLRDTLALGTAWWFPGGPKAMVNVYSNAFLGVNWLQHGGQLNVYKGGTVSVTNGLNTGTATGPVFAGGADNDTTRSINIENGSTLVLPAAYTTVVNEWITRGILKTYGSPASASEIVIDEANVDWPGRTVVTTTATGPSIITAVRIEIPRTNVFVGGFQRAQVFADFTTATNVNITTSATNLVFRSSNTNVATITNDGQVRATGIGGADLWATVGSLSNSVAIAVSVYTNSPTLIHRYSFSEVSGTTAADSIGGPSGDATLFNAGATFSGGSLALDGIDGYVQLPAGILSGLDAVTIETWTSFAPTIGVWAVLFTFGDSDGTSGHHYISFQPHTGGNTAQTGIKNAATEQNPFFTPVLDGYTNVHITAVYHPEAGFLSIYTNGVRAAINSNITVTLTEAMSTGNPLNYIGRSLWVADPPIALTMDEFRIYDGPLSA